MLQTQSVLRFCFGNLLRPIIISSLAFTGLLI